MPMLSHPGFETDLNHGGPVSLRELLETAEALRLKEFRMDPQERRDVLAYAGSQTGSNVGTREVFATVRGTDQTYWVTGVRILGSEHEPSIVGAIELILESGDDAQQRGDEIAQAERYAEVVKRVATSLYEASGGAPLDFGPPQKWVDLAEQIVSDNDVLFESFITGR